MILVPLQQLTSPTVEHTSYSMIYWSMWLIYVDLNYISKLIKDRGWKLA